jgi:hypothetical protein
MNWLQLDVRGYFSTAILALILLVAASSVAFAQTVTVAWDRNADPHTSGYQVSYGSQPGAYTTIVDAGSAISVPVTLLPGGTYYMVVRAYNDQRELSPASNVASITMPATVTPPTASITATLVGTGTAAVRWQSANATSVTINGAPAALTGSTNYPVTRTTTYTIVATGAGGSATASATVVVPNVDCRMSAFTFTSATAWGTCSSGVRSRTETWTRTILTQPSGSGAACGPLQEQRVVREPCAVAAAPTARVTATAGTAPGTASVTWTSTNATTARLNGVSVPLSGTSVFTVAATTTYTLSVSGAGGSTTASATFVVTTPVDCVVSAWSLQTTAPWGACTGGQQTRTENWARAVITSPSNGGAACGPLTETRTAAQACSAPAPLAPGTPNDLRAGVSGNAVTLSWGVPTMGGAASGYRIWVGFSTAWELVNGMAVGNVLSATGALPNGTYYARVAAYNDVGASAASGVIRFRVGARRVPSRPTGFTGSLDGAVAMLAWAAPLNDDEDAPTGYLIEAGSAPGLSDLAVVRVGNQSRYQAPVPPGIYYVRIRAINALGLGEASPEVVLQYGAGPGAPGALLESGNGSTVRFSWSAPGTGDLAASYRIEAGSGPGLADLAVLRVGDATSFVTTAPPGTYYVRVRGVSANGTAGAASNEIIVRR